MRKSDIVIYEKDSIDLTFELEGTNELITNFEADDKIVFALRMFNSGPAILFKEKTGITGTQVTFSLDKHDTFRLRPQRYVYDIMVLKGATQQTTVCKSAYFTVADKQVPIKDKAIITMDALTQYNLLKNAVQGYANEALNNALAASTSADRARDLKTSVEQTVASATSEINQRVQTVKGAETNVLQASNGFDKRVDEAYDNIIAQETTSINNVLAAEKQASLNADNINATARMVVETERIVRTLREETRIDAIDAHENEEAAKRYAQQAYDISKEIVDTTAELREAAAQVQPRIEQLGEIADELTEAAKDTAASVIEANQAVADSKANADIAVTKAEEAATSATNAEGSYQDVLSVVDDIRADVMQTVVAEGYLKRLPVDSLPSITEADPHTIYMVLQEDGKDDNYRIEYMAINGKWEVIGSSQVDLELYALSTELEAVDNKKADKSELATVAFSGKYSDLSGLPDLSGAGSGGNVYELQKVDFVAGDWTLVDGKYRLGTSVKDIIEVYAQVGEGYQKTFVEIHRDTTATLFSPVAFSGFYQYGTNLTGVTDKNGRDIVDTYATKQEVEAKVDTATYNAKMTALDTSISNLSDQKVDKAIGDVIIETNDTENRHGLLITAQNGKNPNLYFHIPNKKILGLEMTLQGGITWDGKMLATQEWANGDVQNNLKAYLPLRVTETALLITKADNSGYIGFCGGTGADKAPYIALHGYNYDSNNGVYKGRFDLVARNETQRCSLIGKPNGDLTWNEKDLVNTSAEYGISVQQGNASYSLIKGTYLIFINTNPASANSNQLLKVYVNNVIKAINSSSPASANAYAPANLITILTLAETSTVKFEWSGVATLSAGAYSRYGYVKLT